MSPAALLLAIFGITLLAVFSALRRSHVKRSASRLPPGNLGWPIIGESLSFMKIHPSYTLGTYMASHLSRYGKIFKTNLFGNLAIISVDPELNHFVLQNDMRLFEPGWPRHFVKLVGESAIPVSSGHIHKHQRSFFLSCFGSQRLQTWFLQDAERYAARLIGSWKSTPIIYMKEESMKFTFNIMVNKIMGMEPGAAETVRLMAEFENFLAGMFVLPLNFPGTTYWKALQSRSYIHNVIKTKMEKRMQKVGGTTNIEADDLLGYLLQNDTYSMEQNIDLLRNVIASAYLTTSRIIPTVIYFLGKCPEAVEKLREEHLQVVQAKSQSIGGKLTWEAYKQMRFTHCVINESMRLGSGSVLPKKASADIEYKGFVIPRGCTVLVHLSAMHLDESIFKEPEIFNPWRWLDMPDSAICKKFMPFGGGARHCPGNDVAKLEMVVFLHHLILNYNWKMVTSECPMTVAHVEFLHGLPIELKPLF